MIEMTEKETNMEKNCLRWIDVNKCININVSELISDEMSTDNKDKPERTITGKMKTI